MASVPFTDMRSQVSYLCSPELDPGLGPSDALNPLHPILKDSQFGSNNFY